ncbi:MULTISPECIES: DEAD/DEAH box helicase family protein [Acidiphilium]|uniref:DEAD/DEAH box helicase family protein n=1 Tax=Acidiphilium TaxID=522 RepID=UPI0025809817|nr:MULTISPECIES: DEAD/DEAH box helicase [Acidiphilium]HQT86484.1 DEAD/DEAH box helicase [Acidiphilium rubrum]
MVDFKKLRESKAKPKPVNPREIFNALPKPPGINDLYASQAEVLDNWFLRRNEQDVVVKLHTGGGKTLVALLMAQSVMNEIGEPVLYLAPTNQLVGQVLAKIREYGISAQPYTKGQPLPGEFYDGKSVLVGAYETLFTGRSKFGVRGDGRPPVKVGAIILDDAHVALTSVREAFTLTISVKDHADVYADLAGRFRVAFREVGRSGTFSDITNGKDYGVVEVPSWAWNRKLPEVQDYLSQHVDAIDSYVWPFLRDNLAFCHCLFSRTAVAITPIFPPVDLVPTFEDCARRIYMSATIADDSEIVRTFGASPEAIAKPHHIDVAGRRRRAHDPRPGANEARGRPHHSDGQRHFDLACSTQERRGDPRAVRPGGKDMDGYRDIPGDDKGRHGTCRRDAIGFIFRPDRPRQPL